MATPPRVLAEEATAAIGRIRQRRVQIDDPHAWRLSDDLLDVLAYLRQYSGGIPRWVAEADVIDGLTLRIRLWWLGEEAELSLLQAARRLQVPPASIGTRLGIGTRQGVHDRLRLARRKVATLRGQPGSVDRDAPRASADQAWLTEHKAAVGAVAAEALRFTDLADAEAAEWLVEVARDVRDGAMTPGSLQTLRFAIAELQVSEAVAAAAPEHPVHALLARWAARDTSRPA